MDLLPLVRRNLIVGHHEDDALLEHYIGAAVSYAEGYQHLSPGYYETHEMSSTTVQGVVMLAAYFYESRDGSTAGFFGDNVQAASNVWEVVRQLFRLDREWKV